MSEEESGWKPASQNASSATSVSQATLQEPSPATLDTESLRTCSKLLARVNGLIDYLYQIVEDGLVTQRLAHMAWDAWKALSASGGPVLPVPDACPGPDGQLLYTWERGEHYLELEIFPDRPAEFFYQNEASGDTWEADYAIGEPIPPEAAAKLRLFV